MEPLKTTKSRDTGERLKEMETITLVALSMSLILEKELCMIKRVMLFNLELGDDFFLRIKIQILYLTFVN